MAESLPSDLIEADLDDQFGPQRLPFPRTVGGPTARSARRASGETRRLDHRLQPWRQFGAFRPAETGGEADVIKAPRVVVQPEQQRADQMLAARIAEAADHAIGGPG